MIKHILGSSKEKIKVPEFYSNSLAWETQELVSTAQILWICSWVCRRNNRTLLLAGSVHRETAGIIWHWSTNLVHGCKTHSLLIITLVHKYVSKITITLFSNMPTTVSMNVILINVPKIITKITIQKSLN